MIADRRNSADGTSSWQEFLLHHTDYYPLSIAEGGLLYYGNNPLQCTSPGGFSGWQPMPSLAVGSPRAVSSTIYSTARIPGTTTITSLILQL
jgi:hypothetical protein